MCTALRSTSFSSLLYCDHKITKWACVLVHVCELVLILRNSPVPKSVSVFSLGKMLYLRCFLVHALMEFLGNVCHKECNIFQYPRRDSTEFSCCLHWYVVCRNVNFFFFAVIFPINNTFTRVGFLTFNFNFLWQNGRRKYVTECVICTTKNRIAQILGAR